MVEFAFGAFVEVCWIDASRMSSFFRVLREWSGQSDRINNNVDDLDSDERQQNAAQAID
jgi:hypothetical protein